MAAIVRLPFSPDVTKMRSMMFTAVVVMVALLAGSFADYPDTCRVCDYDYGSCTECYLQCNTTCPEGYMSMAWDSSFNCTDPAPGTISSLLPQSSVRADYVCVKCQVANCSVCPFNDVYTCTSCNNGTELQTNDTQCGIPTTQPPGGDNDASDSGSSDNTVAIAVGVVVAGVVVLALAAGVVYILWRRRGGFDGVSMSLSSLKPKKRKSRDPSEDEERSDSRYTKSPVITPREQPSYDHEKSEVEKLPEAPLPPSQPTYDALDVKRQDSQQYGQVEFKEDVGGIYGNSEVFKGATKSPTYANSHMTVARDDDGPSEIYGNDEILKTQGGEQENYMDMTGNSQGPQLVEEDIYQNDPQPTGKPPGHPTQDDVYMQPSDQPGNEPTSDELYLNEAQMAMTQGAAAQDDVYLNQEAGLIEENVYGNT
ncbi:hypothetical protein PoB_001453200 [Plakobranchus ocellatus]|uniref:4Fe-4S ferredoxin-type domain-containing protein n=1 Tax=Plakobranchus ocellatus TaxID=259542 RepID=A0AAV3Z0M1_9GAST|nr:hypothetical protein PoB_001453200 [Plakobranchus ocellatus]